jgi:integrase
VSGRRHVSKGNRYRVLTTSRTKGIKASSINTYLKLLRTVLRRAHFDWKTLAKLPTIRMAKDATAKQQQGKHRKPPRFLKGDEEQRFMKASPFYLRDFLTFLLGTGARKSEAITLTWDQIDNLQLIANPPAVGAFGRPLSKDGVPFARVRFEHVPDEGRKTKGGKWRSVPLPEHVRELLLRMRAAQIARGYTGNRVFLGCDQYGKRWSEVKTLDAIFNRARRDAGLDLPAPGEERITQHSMRHTYASRLVMAGVALDRVRDLLGHERIEQTEIYAQLAPSSLVDAVAVLDDYAPKPLGKLKLVPKVAA